MQTKEKKTRYKEDFRIKILEAAKKLFLSEGIEATSIRKIAKEIEFSPTTIYLYYKDKSDIVYALHREGFTMLRTCIEPLTHVGHPFERLKALGKAYLAFAMQEPGFYEVIFMMKEPMNYLDANCAGSDWEEGDRVFDFLEQTIQDCQNSGYFKDIDPHVLSLQAWSTVHGIASLFISGHLKKMGNMSEAGEGDHMSLESLFLVYANMLERLK